MTEQDLKAAKVAIEKMMLTPADKFVLLRSTGEGVDVRSGSVDPFEAIQMLMGAIAGYLAALKSATESTIIDPSAGRPFPKAPVKP
jgi:hypothetical protein